MRGAAEYVEDMPERIGTARIFSGSTMWPTPRNTTGAAPPFLPATGPRIFSFSIRLEDTTLVCSPFRSKADAWEK